MSKMRKLLSMLLPEDRVAEPPVHFHSGPQGLPAVCHDVGCRSPRLDV